VEVGEVEFHIRMLVREKVCGFVSNFISVYGAPHAKDMDMFLIELVHAISCNNFTSLVGRDFNIIRTSSESNMKRKTNKWLLSTIGILGIWIRLVDALLGPKFRGILSLRSWTG
jgi:hypothetical protein